MLFSYSRSFIPLSIVVLSLAACGGGGGEEGGPSTSTVGGTSSSSGGTTTSTPTTETTISAFPASLSVASPTSVSAISSSLVFNRAVSSPAVAEAVARSATNGVVYDYEFNTAVLKDLILGGLDIDDEIEFDLLFDNPADAACYGPYMPFENHPNAPSGSDTGGELPTGDLGLWSEKEGTDTEACAAAQLNKRMTAVNDRSSVALMMLAGMISAYEEDSSRDWPEDMAAGTSVNLLAAVNRLGINNTSFSEAIMSLGSDGKEWNYSLSFNFDLNSTTRPVVLSLKHVVGATDDEYEGLLNFRVGDTMSGGNCGSGTNSVTINGSLHYIQASATDLVLQYREAKYCGSAVNALQTPVTSSKLTGNMVSAQPTGTLTDNWSDNYTVFTADFNPSTLGGTYSYAWQAGFNDSNTRVLNVGLQATTVGEAYFGYGFPVQSSSFDGGIKGFICNWAGPGNDHTLQNYVQRQHITLDTNLGVYSPTNAASSDIVYAPTNSCKYNSLDGDFISGSPFQYDRNLDSAINSSDLSDVVDTLTDSSSQVDFGLRDIPSTSSASDIFTYITQDRGYALPDYP